MFEGENATATRILEAAFRCITAKGYAQVSMRDIADEAGVVLSQLNYYFRNKEGLFTEVVRGVKREYLRDITANLELIPTTSEKVDFLIRYCQRVIRENTAIYRIILDFFSMAMWSPSFTQELRAFFKEVTDVIGTHIVGDCSVQEDLQAYTPELITRMIIGATFGIAMQYILDPDGRDILDCLNIIQAVIKA